METRFFGIRHHGPGCARALRAELERFEPDCLLVEGPPEGDALLGLLGERLEPPVALLVYRPDRPQRAIFFPFAHFSPEWQALSYAHERGLEARFFDLPAAQRLALLEPTPNADEGGEPSLAIPAGEPERVTAPLLTERDPLVQLAQAAGYEDDDEFWEEWFERRERREGVFEAIAEAMRTLRAPRPATAGVALTDRPDRAEAEPERPELSRADQAERLELCREAQMRLQLRRAASAGCKRLAVVCGAWHVPALERLPSQKSDRELLRGLPKVKVACTFVPWTYRRLGVQSGYGAGVRAPGWYDHLWRYGERANEAWIAALAHELRGLSLDAAPSSAIDAVRLADALAALRGRPRAGYRELMDAAESALCGGERALLRRVEARVAIGERIGRVPDTAPRCPLEEDLTRQCRRLRLAREAAPRVVELDLRKPLHLERSHLFHRLVLLGFEWAEREEVSAASGTFHENWRLEWEPELSIRLVELGAWGNTIALAAAARVGERARTLTDLAALTELVADTLLADLETALRLAITRLEQQAALSYDLPHLCLALPPLVRVLRYGNVRETNRQLVREVVDVLAPRICVGFAPACRFVDNAYAAELVDHLQRCNGAFALLGGAYDGFWDATLAELAAITNVHPLLAARAVRYRFDAGRIPHAEARRRLAEALSATAPPAEAAGWFEGFFEGSGLLLVHDPSLFELLDGWLLSLSDEELVALLPLLRRTAASFEPAERRQLFARVQGAELAPSRERGPSSFDPARALALLPLLELIFGVPRGSGGVDEPAR